MAPARSIGKDDQQEQRLGKSNFLPSTKLRLFDGDFCDAWRTLIPTLWLRRGEDLDVSHCQ